MAKWMVPDAALDTKSCKSFWVATIFCARFCYTFFFSLFSKEPGGFVIHAQTGISGKFMRRHKSSMRALSPRALMTSSEGEAGGNLQKKSETCRVRAV